jgi:CelD/BcsL family acetyltransferase involved in cellulose biosynthesis
VLDVSLDSPALLLDPLADPRWPVLISSSREAMIFHHPAWLRLLCEQYGYEMIACAIADSDGVLLEALPLALVASRLTGRRLVALPFSDICQPVSIDGADHGLTDALARLHSEAGLTLRVHAPLPALGEEASSYRHHTVRLEPDLDAVQKRFTRSSALRGARRAQRDGVTVENRTDADALAEFYRLHVRSRRRQGVPTQPRRFIMGFAELFGRGLGFVSLARAEGRVIAAAVMLNYNGTLVYKYGASDPGALSLRPNNLIFSEAIAWGCSEGLHSLDLGRTDLHHDSLSEFKRMWGADERILAYTEAPTPKRQGTDRAGRALGALIRHAPPAFGQGLGQVLYRHVG